VAQRTYALFDVIGVKRALGAGDAPKLLTAFWQVAEDWTNHRASHLGPLRHATDYATIPSDPILRTYSDSALLSTPEEVDIESFYRLVQDLKRLIEERVGAAYVVVNRDDEIAPPEPAMWVSGRGDPTPRYINISGSGPAFINLYLADDALKHAKAWRKEYSLYCVGEESRFDGLPVRDALPIPCCTRRLLALG
jgi:hypothetical protein